MAMHAEYFHPERGVNHSENSFWQSCKRFLPQFTPRIRINKAKGITQFHGSLEGTEILAKVRELETIKQIEEKVKRNGKKEFAISSYFRCKIVYNCTKVPCEASGLKQCKLCKEIKKSFCGRK